MTLEEFKNNYNKEVAIVEKNLATLQQVIAYDKEIGIGNYSYCDILVLKKSLCDELFKYYENIYGINYMDIKTNRLNIDKIYFQLVQINEKKNLFIEYEITSYSLMDIDQRILSQFYDILYKNGYSFKSCDKQYDDIDIKIMCKNYADYIQLQRIITDFIFDLRKNPCDSYFGDILKRSIEYNCEKLESYLNIESKKQSLLSILSCAGIDTLNFKIESISEFNKFLDFLISLKRSEFIINAFNNDLKQQEDVVRRILKQN